MAKVKYKSALLGTNHGVKYVDSIGFVADTSYRLETDESHCTLLDSNGELIMYGNESYLYSPKHKILNPNHPFLGESSSAQGSFLYQHPERNVVDFFHNKGSYSLWNNTGVYHSEFEFNGDSIFNIMTDTIFIPTVEAMAVITHENGIDLCVITHEAGRDKEAFIVNLLTKDGIQKSSIME